MTREEIDAARAVIVNAKAATPNVFVEHQRLEHARTKLQIAQRDLAEAQTAWDELGTAEHTTRVRRSDQWLLDADRELAELESAERERAAATDEPSERG